MLPQKIQPFVDLGYVCIAAEYRFVGEAKCPAQIEDVKACVRWTRGNAGTLGVEPDRIVNGGSFAGAHLRFLPPARAPGPSLMRQAATALLPVWPITRRTSWSGQPTVVSISFGL